MNCCDGARLLLMNSIFLKILIRVDVKEIYFISIGKKGRESENGTSVQWKIQYFIITYIEQAFGRQQVHQQGDWLALSREIH